jgi:hypothetical protein
MFHIILFHWNKEKYFLNKENVYYYMFNNSFGIKNAFFRIKIYTASTPINGIFKPGFMYLF